MPNFINLFQIMPFRLCALHSLPWHTSLVERGTRVGESIYNQIIEILLSKSSPKNAIDSITE